MYAAVDGWKKLGVWKVYRGSRQGRASTQKGDPARIIRQMSLQQPELKIIRAQEITQGNHHNWLPLLTVLQESNYGWWVFSDCFYWVLPALTGIYLTKLILNALLEKGRATQEEKNAEKPTDVRGQEMKEREVERDKCRYIWLQRLLLQL